MTNRSIVALTMFLMGVTNCQAYDESGNCAIVHRSKPFTR
jgi:hypothetical protein